jgi:CHASE3 domain sensor protein
VIIHPKKKIIIGLLVVGSTILLTLGTLFYFLSNNGSISNNVANTTSTEVANTMVENVDTKEAPHFSIFSILNKLIPN